MKLRRIQSSPKGQRTDLKIGRLTWKLPSMALSRSIFTSQCTCDVEHRLMVPCAQTILATDTVWGDAKSLRCEALMPVTRLNNELLIADRRNCLAFQTTRPPLLSSTTRLKIPGLPGCSRLAVANARPPYRMIGFLYAFRIHSSISGSGFKQ